LRVGDLEGDGGALSEVDGPRVRVGADAVNDGGQRGGGDLASGDGDKVVRGGSTGPTEGSGLALLNGRRSRDREGLSEGDTRKDENGESLGEHCYCLLSKS